MIHQPCPYIACGSSDAFSKIIYDPSTGILFRSDLGREVGSPSKTGYLTFSFKGRIYYNHRVAFYLIEGRWPTQIDHINRVRADNTWSNLREVTSTQQSTNKCGWSNTGKKGVYWNSIRSKYHARVRYQGKVHHVGYFDNLEEAKQKYDELARELHGEYFNG